MNSRLCLFYPLQISYVVVSWEISWATSNLRTILATIRLMWTVSGPLTLRTRGASLLLYQKSSSLLRMSAGMFLSWGRVVWYTCRFGCWLIIAARIHVIELLPSLFSPAHFHYNLWDMPNLWATNRLHLPLTQAVDPVQI